MTDKYFIPYCNMIIRHFARRFQLSVQQAFRYLYNFKGIHFLQVGHAHSPEYNI